MIPADAGDHAFANGLVFSDPGGLLAAILATRGWRHARRLQNVWRQFLSQSHVEADVKLSLSARLVNLGNRDKVIIRSGAIVRGILKNERGGRIELGREVYIGDDVIISAAAEVVIGAHTMVAHGVQLFDNNTHPLDPAEREYHLRMIVGLEPQRPVSIGKAPIRIGHGCWIGMNSVVLKGVSIGNNTIVGAGSVVVRDLPDGVVAVGNPARIARRLGF
jgi:acetyltransferase-like isoleucine patch superfamily enzyme